MSDDTQECEAVNAADELAHNTLDASEQGDLAAVEQILGYRFKQSIWLERALTHRSVLRFGKKTDYERLEFLGDAVFDLVVADLLLSNHPNLREGDLSKMRAALVNTESLAEVARSNALGTYIRMSKGEQASGAQERSSILADVVEAIVGGVYRDGGYECAASCVRRLIGKRVLTVTPRDPKTELQERLHALGSEGPVYKLEAVEGPEHAPTFISIVEIDGICRGRGRGSSKKSSHQAAAEEALNFLRERDTSDLNRKQSNRTEEIENSMENPDE